MEAALVEGAVDLEAKVVPVKARQEKDPAAKAVQEAKAPMGQKAAPGVAKGAPGKAEAAKGPVGTGSLLA